MKIVKKLMTFAVALCAASVLAAGASSGREYRLDFSGDVSPRTDNVYAVGDVLALRLPGGYQASLRLVEKLPGGLGGCSFLAEVDGRTGVRNAVVVSSAEGLRISAQDPVTHVKHIVSARAGGSVKVRSVRPEEAKARYPIPPLRPPELTQEEEGRVRTAAQVRTARAVTGSAPVCVDILTAYDSRARAWAIDNGGMTNFSLTAVAKMNAALANNGLDSSFRFRLVGITTVDEAGYADFNFTLKAVRNGYSGWTDIKAAREACGADVVTTFIDTGSAYGTTGLGYELGKDTKPEVFAESAFNVCSIRAVDETHTMTHEVGHNMGCGHSDRQGTQPGPQRYPYSSGYYFSTPEGKNYHTIMAYTSDGVTSTNWTEVPYFSSPVHYHDGVPVGDELHDNARTLKMTFAAVAAFRAGKAPEIEQGEPVEPAPTWYTSRDEAVADAQATGRRILMVCGQEAEFYTEAVRGYINRNNTVKGLLSSGFVCWYDDCDSPGTKLADYLTGQIRIPVLVVIDPKHPKKSLDVRTGATMLEDLVAFLKANHGSVRYTVKFDANGGTGEMEPMVLASGEARKLAPNAFTRRGYAFSAWKDENGRTFADCEEVSNLATEAGETVTLRAEWTPNAYTVSFDANGGTGTMPAMPFSYGTSAKLAPCAFTPPATVHGGLGVLFNGWATNSTGAVIYGDGDSVRDLTDVNGGEVRLYAVWEEVDNRVVFLGEGCALDLEKDLGVTIDAVAGDKVAVKVEGLPKGLKLVQDASSGRMTITGRPTEVLDFAEAPAYARVTVTKRVGTKQVKTETLKRIMLGVEAKIARTFAAGADVTGDEAVPVVEGVTAVTGLPSGLKFNAKGSPRVIAGVPSKPGLFAVTFKRGGVSEVEYWQVTADNPGAGAEDVDWERGRVFWSEPEAKAVLLQGAVQELRIALPGSGKVTVTGLPSGLRFDAKTGTIAGVATKVEAKVVSVKVVQNGLTVVKRFAMEVAANPFAGTYHAFFTDEGACHVATAVVTPAAGGTAKVVYEEYVPSAGKTVKYTLNDPKGFTMEEAYDPARPANACVRYTYALKADAGKNPDFGTAARTVSLVLSRVPLTDGVIGNRGELSVKREGTETPGWTAGVEKVVTADDFALLVEKGLLGRTLPVFPQNVTESDSAAEPAVCAHFGYFSAAFDAKKLQYAVKGRLWDGTSVSALAPLTWRIDRIGPEDAASVSVPFFLKEKKGAKRVILGAVRSDAGFVFCDEEGTFPSKNDVCLWDAVPGTAAEVVGAAGGTLLIDEEEWRAAGNTADVPAFPMRVNGAVLAKAKVDVLSPAHAEGDKPLKSLASAKLAAGSGFVFKISFKWDVKAGGDGSTYSFELVPVGAAASSEPGASCFSGRCDVKPAKGSARTYTARLATPSADAP